MILIDLFQKEFERSLVVLIEKQECIKLTTVKKNKKLEKIYHYQRCVAILLKIKKD